MQTLRLLAGALVVTVAVVCQTGFAVHQPQDPAARERAKEVVERAKAAYGAVTTYQDRTRMRYVVETEGADELSEFEWTMEVSYSRDGGMKIKGDDLEFYSDGSTAWIVSPKRREYIRRSIGPGQTPGDLMADLPEASYLVPPSAQWLWRRDKQSPLLGKQVQELLSVAPAQHGGVDGVRVLAKGEWAEADTSEVGIEIWVSDRTGLVGEFVTDLTGLMKKQSEEMAAYSEEEDDALELPKIRSAKYVYEFDDIRTGQEIAPETFVFKPDSDSKEVEEFSQPSHAPGEQMALLGKEAPAIRAKLLDGKEFSLESLKGKVVLLDFWATWCGPCVQAIPHVQSLSDSFAGKNVAVIGINQDQGATAKVQKFVDRKKITLPQVMDEGEIGEAYHISGIPCMVLIDTKGVVQDIKVGFAPDEAEELKTSIEKLLDGKDLRTAEEVAELVKDASEGAPTPMGLPKLEPNPLAEISPQRLVPMEGPGRMINGFYGAGVKQIDTDGDGVAEHVSSGMSGELLVMVAGTGEVKRVKVSGVSRFSSIADFDLVRHDGKAYWLVLINKFSMSGTSETEIAMYDSEGAQRWVYRPTELKGLYCQSSMAFGDLDGDAIPEVVVGLSPMKMDNRAGKFTMPTQYGASLVVLGFDGKELSRVDLKGRLTFVTAAGATRKGEQGTVTCVVDQKVRRFAFDPSREGPAAADK